MRRCISRVRFSEMGVAGSILSRVRSLTVDVVLRRRSASESASCSETTGEASRSRRPPVPGRGYGVGGHGQHRRTNAGGCPGGLRVGRRVDPQGHDRAELLAHRWPRGLPMRAGGATVARGLALFGQVGASRRRRSGAQSERLRGADRW
jgi:hypothetical protein